MVRDSLSNFIIFAVAFMHREVVRTSLPLISSEKQLCATDEMSERAEVVVITGASPVGEADSFPAAFESHF
jgi:molybdopterin biosynthesis enzyme